MKTLFIGLLVVSTSISAMEHQISREQSAECVTLLQTAELTANVNIVTLDDKTSPTVIKYSGSTKSLDELDFQVDKGTFLISGKRQKNRPAGISFGVIYINGLKVSSSQAGNDHELPHITISIPKSCALTLDAVGGVWTIGHSYQPATISIQGNAEVKVQAFHAGGNVNMNGAGSFAVEEVEGDSFSARLRGSADISIEEMTVKNAIFALAGSGDISVNGGKIYQGLTATLVGSGDIGFGGTATSANLSLAGSGDIKIKEVVNEPIRSVKGNGDIKVMNWPMLKRNKSRGHTVITVRYGSSSYIASGHNDMGADQILTNAFSRLNME